MEVTRRKCDNTQAGEVAVKKRAGFLKRSRWTYGKGKSCINLLRKGKMGSDKSDTGSPSCGPECYQNSLVQLLMAEA